MGPDSALPVEELERRRALARRASQDRWLAYIERKVELARQLARGELGGDYGDAVVLLAVRISSLAARMWAGRGIDQVRFVEALVRWAPPELQVTRISVPLLIEDLHRRGHEAEAEGLVRKVADQFTPGIASRVLSGDTIDREEAEVQVCCPSLSREELRRFSYAGVFYAQFRSALVHEARVGDLADQMPHSTARGLVNYTNTLDHGSRRAMHRLHFDVEWPARATLGIALAVAPRFYTRDVVPTTWWARGG